MWSYFTPFEFVELFVDQFDTYVDIVTVATKIDRGNAGIAQ